MLFEDITEINKLKKQVQEQERKAIAGDLATGFVHEIRNPLSVAGGVIQLLEIVDDPKRQLILIEIPKVIKEIEFLIKSDANLNNIKLTIDESSEQFPLMKGDSTHLKQVFLNIMKNAIEAMEDGGELKIAYYHNSKKVGVIFEDNGPGIAEENLPLILESFFTTKDTGTGLGLSVSSELVKSMDGELKIESILGKGTTVMITFPVFRPTKNARDHNN